MTISENPITRTLYIMARLRRIKPEYHSWYLSHILSISDLVISC
jgi:hypothetical protein